jgi:hypothetical protein
MRILQATALLSTVFAIACGNPPKKESSIVNDKEMAATCCCKTIPQVGEKEIVPNYNMNGRMECSTSNGECVDDVQCQGQEGQQTQQGEDGTPPPPPLQPSTTGGIGE